MERKMIEQVATNLGVNSDEPNIKLAEKIIEKQDKNGVKEIIDGIKNKNKQIQSDCIKVLYEIGYRDPDLISKYVDDFTNLLKSKNNRLVWGSTIALATIAELKSEKLYEKIEDIYAIYKAGSVITIDNCISIFAGIAKANIEYEKKILNIFVEHFSSCRTKEIAQHLERASICMNARNSKKIIDIILNRFSEMTDSQKKRVDKVVKKIK
jgi:hypothetical protein